MLLPILIPLSSIFASSSSAAEDDHFVGQPVVILSTGQVATITGYTFETEKYSATLQPSTTLRLLRSDFEAATLREGARFKLSNVDGLDLGEDDFNGKQGTVINSDDSAQVVVVMDEPCRGRKHWTFPAVNLFITGYANLETVAPGFARLNQRVTITNLPGYEGATGEVVSYSPEDEEYSVALDGVGSFTDEPTVLRRLKRDNLI